MTPATQNESNQIVPGLRDRLLDLGRHRWLAGWKWWKRRRLPQLLGELSEREIALTQLARQVEQRFITIGREVQEQVDFSDTLLQTCQRLPGCGGKSDSDQSLTKGTNLVLSSLAAIERCQQETNSLIEALQTHYARLIRLQRTEVDWQRIIRPLKIIQTLFRIESAPLANETQVFFIALTDSIRNLDLEVSQAMNRQYASLAVTRQGLESLFDLLRQAAEQQATALARREQVRAALAGLEAQARDQANRQAAMVVCSQRLGDPIRQVVVALQFQDITRQKLEHVQAGMRQILESAPLGGRQAEVDWGRLPMACRLQVVHLQSVVDDLSRARDQISAGTRQLLNEVSELERRAFSSAEITRMGQGVDAMTQVLLDALDTTGRQLQTTLSGFEATGRTTVRFNEVAADVHRTIHRLAADIRLIALNAQIQVAPLRTHTGLEVLTEFTRGMAVETEQFSQMLEKEVGALETGLRDVSDRSRQAQERLRAELEQFDQEAGEQRQALRQYQAETRRTLEAIVEQLAGLHQKAQSAMPSASWNDLQIDTLGETQSTLRDLEQLAKAVGAANQDAVAVGGELAALRRQYTMESERQVYAAVLREQEKQPAPSAPACISRGPANPPAPEREAKERTPALTAIAALEPAPEQVEPPVPVEANNPKSGFGDNVELF